MLVQEAAIVGEIMAMTGSVFATNRGYNSEETLKFLISGGWGHLAGTSQV